MNAYFNLPKDVFFCKRCVVSNQRPSSIPEFKHKTDREGAKYINIDTNGICDACKHAETKERIDWNLREEELIELLDKYRSKDGSYDCLVPGSGGKDSIYQSHILKYKYNMNPLTLTWAPIMYTDYGYKNFIDWINIGGFDNINFKPNGLIQKKLTQLSLKNLLHPFQTFILGQKNLAPKIAIQNNIDLIFYGENEAEYGNPIAGNSTSLRDKSFFIQDNIDDIYLAGLPLKELEEEHNISKKDLYHYLPIINHNELATDIQVHYLGYYLKWDPQEIYYYAHENTNFSARPFRSQGTFSKYSSIDDKIDDLHWYTTFIKFGIGRATHDASQEIRNKHINREEGCALVNKFDGEFPDKYFLEIMDYLEMEADEFYSLCDKFRSPHLWEYSGNKWNLKHTVKNES